MAFNEMISAENKVREPYAKVESWLKQLGKSDVTRAIKESEARFRKQGITFAVYGDEKASERLISFDIVPRIFCGPRMAQAFGGH